MTAGRPRFGAEIEAPAPFGTSFAFQLSPEGLCPGSQTRPS
jgi:hypothetical protein